MVQKLRNACKKLGNTLLRIALSIFNYVGGIMTTGPAAANKASAISQINIVRLECAQLLTDIKVFSPPDAHGEYNPTFRLIATPMLYSAWERCFTLCNAIALRLIRDTTTQASLLPASRRAAWLIKDPSYRSFADRLRQGAPATPPLKVKKGEYSFLSEFLTQYDNWGNAVLDPAITTDELVMTFSNVNPDVVEINALAIGITNSPRFKAIKFGRLHDLVGQRNDIGHGGLITPPANYHFVQLMTFTEKLVDDYCDAFIEWINSEF